MGKGIGKFFTKATLKPHSKYRKKSHPNYRTDNECEAKELFLKYDEDLEGWLVMKADKGRWPNSNEVLDPKAVEIIFYNFSAQRISKEEFFAEML